MSPGRCDERSVHGEIMRVLICDGDNMAARMQHVFAEAHTPDGFPTGALYGCVISIKAAILRFSANAVVFVMDYGVPRFRFQLCPEYKQQRQDKRDEREERAHIDRKKQMAVIHKVLKPLGVVTARAEGWEGDDVVNALVHRLAKHDLTVISSDKDFTQCIRPGVVLYDPIGEKCREWDEHYVLKRCLDPKASDNLDGVTGIGPAKADKLVAAWVAAQPTVSAPQYLDAFLAWCAADPADTSPIGKLRTAVAAQSQKVRANWKCTNLALTVDDCNNAIKFRRSLPDRAAFIAVCKEYALAPLLDEIGPTFGAYEDLRCPV